MTITTYGGVREIIGAAVLTVGLAVGCLLSTPGVAVAEDEFDTGSFAGCPVLLEDRSSGSCVRKLQRYLNAVNDEYDLAVTGRFGRDTRIAVLDFQGRNGLDADGNVGDDTARELRRQALEHGSVRSPRPAPQGPGKVIT